MLNKVITHINFAKGFRGGERQTINLIQELSNQGYQQKIVVRQEAPLADKAKAIKNLKIIEIKRPYFQGLSKIKQDDILHAHESKAAQFSYLANLFYGIPYVITRRVDIRIKDNFFNRNIYKNAAHIVALSGAIKKRILALVKPKYLTIIPSILTTYHVDSTSVDMLRRRFKGKFVVGVVAALEKEKGQQFVLKAAKLLQNTHKEIHFVFLGVGRDERLFRAEASTLDNVSFEGFVDNVGDYFTIFDLFVLPTLSEGFGSSIIDAMSFGVPVIATRVGGVPDIIDSKEKGVLVDILNLNQIDKEILILYKDAAKREQLVQASYKAMRQYKVGYITQKYVEIYYSIELG